MEWPCFLGLIGSQHTTNKCSWSRSVAGGPRVWSEVNPSDWNRQGEIIGRNVGARVVAPNVLPAEVLSLYTAKINTKTQRFKNTSTSIISSTPLMTQKKAVHCGRRISATALPMRTTHHVAEQGRNFTSAGSEKTI